MLKFLRQTLWRKKNRTRANLAIVQFLFLKFLTDLWIKHLGPNGWYKNFFVKKKSQHKLRQFYKYFFINSRISFLK